MIHAALVVVGHFEDEKVLKNFGGLWFRHGISAALVQYGFGRTEPKMINEVLHHEPRRVS